MDGMMRPLVAFLLLGLSVFAEDLPPGTLPAFPKFLSYTNVVVTKLNQESVSFRHDDGVTTLPLSGLNDSQLDLLFPGHLAKVKATEDQADARDRAWWEARKRELEKDPAALARAKQEDDIHEAALRRLLTGDASPEVKNVSVIDIWVEQISPSEDFLKRFEGNKPPLRREPRSRVNIRYQSELWCAVYGLKWITETEAKINAGWSTEPDRGSGAEATYTVSLTNEGWKVIAAYRHIHCFGP